MVFKEEIKESTIDTVIDLTIENIEKANNVLNENPLKYDRPAIKIKLKEIIKIKKGW